MGRHVKPSLAVARRILGNADDAEEVVQEAFLRVWGAAARWRPDSEARFSTWLYRIVVNLCLDRRRRPPSAPLEEAGETEDEGPDGLEQAVRTRSRDVMAEALRQLPARQRAAIAVYYFEDVSAPEAARILDVSLSALESLLVRARRTLRKTLADRGVDGMGDLL